LLGAALPSTTTRGGSPRRITTSRTTGKRVLPALRLSTRVPGGAGAICALTSLAAATRNACSTLVITAATGHA